MVLSLLERILELTMVKSLNGRLVLPNILTKSTKMLVVVQVDKDKVKVNGGRLVIKSRLSSLSFSSPQAITDSQLGLDICLMGPIGQRMSKITTISDWLQLSEKRRLEPATIKQISPNLRTWHSLTG